VQITQDFLIGTDKKYPDVIAFPGTYAVYRQVVGKISGGYEIVNLAV